MLKKWLLLLCLIILAGCGYRFAPGGDYIDPKIKKVFIDNLRNLTAEAYVEDELRRALFDQFTKGGRFKLADTRGDAQAVLTGAIESLSTAHLAVGAHSRALEERINITFNLTLARLDNGQIIWTGQNLVGSVDYRVDRDISVTETNRKKAITRLMQDVAERTYRLMMSGF